MRLSSAGQHEEPEVDVSEFRVESVTPSWNKITFFVVLDTSQSIKRKHCWGCYGGWGIMGSSCKPIRSEVANSDQTL